MNASTLAKFASSLLLVTLLSACGSESESGSVTSTVIEPKVTLTSDRKSIRYNDSITLTWNIQGTENCDASGFDIKTRGKSGNMVIGPITADTTFTISCTTNRGEITESVTVTVQDQPTEPPQLSISASPSAIAYGEAATISWSTVDAYSCSGTGDWAETKNTSNSSTMTTSGTYTIVSVTENSTFTLECTNPVGSVTETATVTIYPYPSISLTASPSNITSGGSTTLSWMSSNTSTCIASGDWSGVKQISGSEVISSITSNGNYQLSCTGNGGSVNNAVSVIVNPQPVVSINASPLTINNGETTTINWNSSNATSCTASGDWSGNKGTSGSEMLSPSSNSSYTISCTGNGGTVNESINVSVNSIPAPTVSISANPSSVVNGGSTTLSWNSSNATSCTATGDWSGNKAASGTQVITAITANSNFNLQCTGNGGQAMDSVAVTVLALPTVTISASPASVSSGGSTTLSWNSSDATTCTASGDWSGTKANSGSQVISAINTDRTFNLQCSGTGGSNSDSISVTVLEIPTISISASPSTVTSGESTTLTWTSSLATSCTATGAWSGTKSTSGSEVISNITSNGTYNLQCTGAGGTDVGTVSVNVAVPAPTITISATPNNISSGESTTISWNTTNASICTASGDWSGSKGTSGSEMISNIAVSSTYYLQCTGSGGVTLESVSISVSAAQTGTAQLSWTPPTNNTDNSPLTDLVGYKFYYGTESGNYTQTITVPIAGITSYVIDNLSSRTWYFTMTAYNSTGVESDRVAEMSKTIP